MLRRILVVVVVLFLIWRFVSAWGKKLRRDTPGADSFSRFSGKSRDRRGQRGREPEELVACDGCGTYVPAQRALSTDGRIHFCSDSCRRASEDSARER